MITTRSHALGSAVRNLRKGAELRLEDLAEKCGWSRATLGRIEQGTRVPTETEVAIITATLGVKGRERERLLELAQDADRGHWWEVSNHKVPNQLTALVDLERRATKITDVAMLLVPGLLQTADYARAVLRSGNLDSDAIESRVSIRLGRQSVLTREQPVQYHALLDEVVLQRPVGGHEVMAEQLRQLARLADRSNVVIQVLPVSVGEHVGLMGGYVLLEFQRQPSVVHLEHRRGTAYLDEPDDTSLLSEAVPTLAEAALTPRESVELIAASAEAMEAHVNGVPNMV